MAKNGQYRSSRELTLMNVMYRKKKSLHFISQPDGRGDVGRIRRGRERQTKP